MRIGLVLLLSLVALTGCRSDQVADAGCRKQFADQQHVLAEHGNPGSKELTPRLTARWDGLDAEFGKLSRTATADDCPARLATMKSRVKRVESVLHKLDDYDVARMMRKGEADLARARRKYPQAARDYALINTYRTLQTSGADAKKSLAGYVATVDAVDPDEYSKLATTMVALYNAAASDAAFADFKDALSTIHNYRPPQK